nr:putative ribonuclease H-like domain-containing protein [Tanacetum cinerariifolium]
MDLCGPIRVESINRKRYVLVIVDDYSRYTWVHFLRSKDETSKVIKTFLKKIQVLLEALDIIIRTDNRTEFTNQVLKTYFDNVGISYQTSSVRTPRQNGVVEQRNRTTKKIMETMNVTFEVFSAMAFEQRSLKPRLQGMIFGQISSRLDLTYASSTITSQKPTKCELELLFEVMYDDYIGGQPSVAPRTAHTARVNQNLQTPNASTIVKEYALTPTNSSSQSLNILNTS